MGMCQDSGITRCYARTRKSERLRRSAWRGRELTSSTRIWILFDAYVHGDIDRRGFLEKAARFAAGGVTATMLLGMLSPKFAEAQQVPKVQF